ncbi:putative phage abortive infection protein [Metapseudomonas boanensis]|uniref:Phage abortive infection protein n=1 Tax=Metapseudomonas boanensis TaxID=2822138 RepID=A0ABS5XIU5_9GAMM|nr:putative phage abortive infection protein [Pseudomonas boanensis]MBT8767565.1 putative phage abortive infection protein [Pseudomonas boanensis]
MTTREKYLDDNLKNGPSISRLKWSFRWMVLKEQVRRIALFNAFRVRDVYRKASLGGVIFASSITLVLIVGVVLFSRFALGVDIPAVKVVNKAEIQYWGQIGDFFGGILNPLLSFMALMAVLYTIRLQREELKEAREETRIANKIQDKQTEIFERQNFESVLFRLLDVHVKITERLMDGGRSGRSLFDILNADARSEIAVQTSSKPFVMPKNLGLAGEWFLRRQHEVSILSSTASEILEIRHKNVLSHYYRNMYQILKIIDGFKAGSQGENDPAVRYFTCRQYSNMLRALLTNDELIMLSLNCLTKTGGGLKKYVEKYSMLKHLELSGCLAGQRMALETYNELAFTDYEKIKPSAISNFYT